MQEDALKPGGHCQGDGDVRPLVDMQDDGQPLVASKGQGDVRQDVQQGGGDSLRRAQPLGRAAQKLKVPGSADFRTQNFLRKCLTLKQI